MRGVRASFGGEGALRTVLVMLLVDHVSWRWAFEIFGSGRHRLGGFLSAVVS